MSSGNSYWPTPSAAARRFTMAGTGMKMKQAVLTKKPDVRGAEPHAGAVRPRIHAALPNAKLLVATKEDLSRNAAST